LEYAGLRRSVSAVGCDRRKIIGDDEALVASGAAYGWFSPTVFALSRNLSPFKYFMGSADRSATDISWQTCVRTAGCERPGRDQLLVT